jgi:dihydrolipoamide dehydrogenase
VAEHEFDVIVVGAGPAGEVAAGRVRERNPDLSVAIVERELIGGECSYYACMPSKGLLRPVELMNEIQRVPGPRETVTGDLDPAIVLARRDEIIHDLDDSAQVPWLESYDIAIFRGEARFTGERALSVGDDELTARKAVVLATGSGASIPPVDGLAQADPWNNRELTTLKHVPESLVIVGGGVVGVEMAQAWSGLGTEVTLVEVLDRLIAGEEEFASEQVADGLREAGVRVELGARIERVDRDDGRVTVKIEGRDDAQGAEIAVAAGRRPHTAELGVEAIGLEPGKPIEVDDQLRSTKHDWLYAIGDCNGRALLTHMGKYQGRVVGDVISGHAPDARVERDDRRSPRVIFTDPQVAAVGYTLAAAKEEGLDVRAVDVDTGANAGSSYVGRNAPGTTRMVIEQERDVIVGATFVGPEVAEFVQAATVAVVGEVPLDRLIHAVAPFPTRSEVWLKLIEADGR